MNENQLNIKVNSFSYLHTGYPKDNTQNNGGFVFDCRGIFNPGRNENHKYQTGLDKEVQDFLNTKTEMPAFLKSIEHILSITIDNYLERGFTNLEVSFGCTGGQHRSVYGAETVGKYLQTKYPMTNVQISHLNKENWKLRA